MKKLFAQLLIAALVFAPLPQLNAAGWLPLAKSSGGGGCSQATAFLARTSGLDATHQTAYTTMICGMVTDGTWALLDAFYVFATSTTTIAQLNLVSSSFTGTTTGTMTFTADSDYTPAAINSYIDTNFNPNTAGGLFTQNSAFAGVWIKSLVNNQASFGDAGALNISQIYPNFGGQVFCRINNATAGGVSNGGNPGLFLGSRDTAASWQCYQNGVSVNTGTDASTALNNDDFSFPGTDGANATGNPIMAGAFGSKMNSTQQANFYSRLHTYLQTIAGIP